MKLYWPTILNITCCGDRKEWLLTAMLVLHPIKKIDDILICGIPIGNLESKFECYRQPPKHTSPLIDTMLSLDMRGVYQSLIMKPPYHPLIYLKAKYDPAWFRRFTSVQKFNIAINAE